MRLWWVRHGPTHAKAFVGWRDLPADLSDVAALARLDAHLPRGALLVSSDLIRASATADAIAQGRERLPHEPDLREFNFGEWDGKHYSEVSRSHPRLSREYWEAPGDAAPPGGESWNAAAARVNAAVDRLCAAWPGREMVLVAHAGVILTQLQRGLGISAHAALGHKIDNLSVTRMAREAGGGWAVAAINHIA